MCRHRSDPIPAAWDKQPQTRRCDNLAGRVLNFDVAERSAAGQSTRSGDQDQRRQRQQQRSEEGPDLSRMISASGIRVTALMTKSRIP